MWLQIVNLMNLKENQKKNQIKLKQKTTSIVNWKFEENYWKNFEKNRSKTKTIRKYLEN